MAVDLDDPDYEIPKRECPRWKRGRKKLLHREKVEVRSLEDGFLGSWHSGIVIACKEGIRRVQYDHLLNDDGSQNVVEFVPVSPAIDGMVSSNRGKSNSRGSIRPLPPKLDSGIWCFHYGLCVDVYHQEAWWEGVIFDHEDGSEERRVFFPDLGDELKSGIEKLRITQDWDEATEKWERRGNWLFLELVEELEQEWPLIVSVKQIWYDMREKKDFRKVKEWTSSNKVAWKELVLEVISDNLALAVTEILPVPNFSRELVLKPQPVLGLPALAVTDAVGLIESNFPLDSAVMFDHDMDSAMGEDGLLMASSSVSSLQNQALSPDNHSLTLLIKKQKVRKKAAETSGFVKVEPEYCPQAVVDWVTFGEINKYPQGMSLKARKHLSAVGWKFWYKDKNGRLELRYTSPEGRSFISLLTACKCYIAEENKKRGRENGLLDLGFLSHQSRKQDDLLVRDKVDGFETGLVGNRKRRHQEEQIACFSKSKKGKISRALIKFGDDMVSDCQPQLKGTRQVEAPSSSHHNPRTVLSWLIDKNVVLPREKVCYRNKKDNRPMAEGRITRDGIKCNCCQKVFTLSRFEAHAGSNYHRPSANIFLADGRSLLKCQMELMGEKNTRGIKTEQHDKLKGHQHHQDNDYICSMCHYGGELILCDQCPSSFHKSCLGLKDVPEGEWFCPSCCCRICGQNKYSEHYLDNSALTCGQCEQQYHMGCLKKRGLMKEGYSEGNWFCTRECEKIFMGLQKLLGKQIAVGVDDMTWTLTKSKKYECHDHIAPDVDALTENHSKLNVALGVMHECFEPVKEPRTKRDIVEDVIFSRGSDLNRLNFRGFYVVLLERNDELISVATLRVYGAKVAEVPLIGTRFQYRRRGMCRILMNQLEKKLVELGVERLVLPAVPSVLNTWTTSFGFSKMQVSERLELLNYIFLDFQGATMCQKLLKEIPSAEASLSRGTRHNYCDDISGTCCNIEIEGNSAVSEVFQAEHIESEIVNQGPVDISACNDGHGNAAPSPHSVVVVAEPTHLNHEPYCDEISLECSDEDANLRRVSETSSETSGKSHVDDSLYGQRVFLQSVDSGRRYDEDVHIKFRSAIRTRQLSPRHEENSFVSENDSKRRSEYDFEEKKHEEPDSPSKEEGGVNANGNFKCYKRRRACSDRELSAIPLAQAPEGSNLSIINTAVR